jgi:hypothetical protein
MSRFRTTILIGAPVALSLALGACATGVHPEGDFPSVTFNVPIDYHAASRRAAEYTRVCHVVRTHPYNELFETRFGTEEKTATDTIFVFKHGEPRTSLETIRVRQTGPQSSSVTVTVVGTGKWNQMELAAAQKSIETAVPSCVDEGTVEERPFNAPQTLP